MYSISLVSVQFNDIGIINVEWMASQREGGRKAVNGESELKCTLDILRADCPNALSIVNRGVAQSIDNN